MEKQFSDMSVPFWSAGGSAQNFVDIPSSDLGNQFSEMSVLILPAGGSTQFYFR